MPSSRLKSKSQDSACKLREAVPKNVPDNPFAGRIMVSRGETGKALGNLSLPTVDRYCAQGRLEKVIVCGRALITVRSILALLPPRKPCEDGNAE